MELEDFVETLLEHIGRDRLLNKTFMILANSEFLITSKKYFMFSTINANIA